MVVRAATTLEISTRMAWDAPKRRDTFLSLTRGAMRYRDPGSWPEILMAPGVEIRTTVFPLGFPPGSGHTSRIVRVDEEAIEVDTNESGGFICTRDHSMKVEPVLDARRPCSDRIEIDAGPLTPLAWLFASLFHRYRQGRWRRLALQLGTGA